MNALLVMVDESIAPPAYYIPPPKHVTPPRYWQLLFDTHDHA
jgi:hypothetical protein